MGGQTGLNTSLALEEMGVLGKIRREMIGAKRPAIEMAEDRKLFREAMDRLDWKIHGQRLQKRWKNAWQLLMILAYPQLSALLILWAEPEAALLTIVKIMNTSAKLALMHLTVSQILIDESLLGWKEFEMEVVRDRADNAIIVCSIENIDPMGVHTGDSITVAPALTLTDKEYQIMRNASIAVLREIGVETGGSNVQWAVNPEDGRMVVIEMNPRVSRSSALASKATGFPIAKIAAKLAVGLHS